MTPKLIALGLAGLTALAGCSTTQLSGGPTEAGSYGSPPPQLVAGRQGLVWVNVRTFGPVPAEDAARGNQICGAVTTTDGSTAVALGYHPAARDQSGEIIEGGGFLCDVL